MGMKFKEFERLERFSILVHDIERHQEAKSNNGGGQQRPTEGKMITLNRDGTATRG